jgi:hypothetical protein
VVKHSDVSEEHTASIFMMTELVQVDSDTSLTVTHSTANHTECSLTAGRIQTTVATHIVFAYPTGEAQKKAWDNPAPSSHLL